MIKKLLLLIAITCVSLLLQAQQVEGVWKLYPTKSSTAGVIYESIGDEVYYMSGSNLFSYDKVSKVINSYNSGNYLSDNAIRNIYYNYEKGYLLVVYENSNIDFLYTHNRVVNVSDLKQTLMMSSKAINDVAFAGDKVYLATDFGIVIIDDTKHEICKSYIYNKAIDMVEATDDYVIALINNKLYVADASKSLFDFNSVWSAVDMGELAPTEVAHLHTINNNSIFFAFDSQAYIYNIEEGTFVVQTSSFCDAKSISSSYNDVLFFSYGTKVEFVSRTLTEEGTLNVISSLTLSQSNVKNGYCSSYNSDGSIWACSASGVSNFTINGSTFTWLVEPLMFNTSSVSVPHIVQVHNNKVYVTNTGPSLFVSSQLDVAKISVLDIATEVWSDLSLDKVKYYYGPKTGVLRSSYNISFDPDSSEIMYIGAWFDGLHKFNGSKYIGNYNKYNSPLTQPWSMLVRHTEFDTDGNLWAVMPYNSVSDYTILACLPADKKKLDSGVSTAADWKTYVMGSKTEHYNDMEVCIKSPHVVFVHGKMVSLNRITILNRETEQMRTFTEFTNQDGNIFGPGILYFLTATEDNNGDVWVGTSNGIIVLPDVENFMDEDYSCIQVKCMNEATNQYEFLLEEKYVFSIAVDSYNRKWIGTSEDGLYLVNEDGSRILGHYTPENSLLPSSTIFSIDIDRATNSVFVGTDMGVASFHPYQGHQSATSYDDVIVLPNPILPDYEGWITVEGLIDNSVVKITDVDGNIYSEGSSDGSTYVWDGRTSTGERVKTGTYLVYAAISGEPNQLVGKIRVVN